MHYLYYYIFKWAKVYYSSAKGTLGWGKNKEDKKYERENGFLGYLVGVKN